MRLALISILVLVPLSTASTTVPTPIKAVDVNPSSIERLVAPCRAAARVSLMTGSTAIMDAYIDNLLAHADRDRDEIIACAAYLAGARDMAEGEIIPIDYD